MRRKKKKSLIAQMGLWGRERKEMERPQLNQNEKEMKKQEREVYGGKRLRECSLRRCPSLVPCLPREKRKEITRASLSLNALFSVFFPLLLHGTRILRICGASHHEAPKKDQRRC